MFWGNYIETQKNHDKNFTENTNNVLRKLLENSKKIKIL